MATAANPVRDEQQRRSGIYTYEAPWPIYAINWSVRNDKKYRLAICSFLEQYPNRVEIVQLDDSTDEIQSHPHLSFEHFYPATKSMFIPVRDFLIPDLLATASDSLQIWHISDDRVNPLSLLRSKDSKFCAPLTSFDWNEFEYRRIGTSSIDTTCTIWDIEHGIIDTQVSAHNKEVLDITWGGVEVFASASVDGSVRIFDLREKEHSTIIYESTDPVGAPLVRVAWNKLDPRYMATITMDSTKVEVLDIRYPSLPVAELQGHKASVNALAWDPHNSRRICTAGDDSQVLIWDLLSLWMGESEAQQRGMEAAEVYGGQGPMLAYTAEAEIEQLQWSAMQPDWMSIAFSNKLQILQV